MNSSHATALRRYGALMPAPCLRLTEKFQVQDVRLYIFPIRRGSCHRGISDTTGVMMVATPHQPS